MQEIRTGFNDLPVVIYFRSSNLKAAVFVTCLLVPVLVIIQFWLVTAGKWTFWDGSTTYTDKLARALLAGQTYLLESPPAELVALSNPYDPASRQGIHFIWDSSLYRGRYYLYWGPVPALFTALIKLIYPHTALDGQIVFLFVVGLLAATSILSIIVCRRWFPDLSGFLIIPVLLLAGLSNPIPYLLTRPSIYEVAICGGQFFLMTAFVWILTGFLANHTSGWRLALGGICAGLAVGCRVVLLFPVSWLTVMVIWRLGRYTKNIKWKNLSFTYLIPLVSMGAGLAYYNLIRFGSIFETGHRYQLNSFSLVDHAQGFSTRYMLPNLYGYLLRPIKITPNEFPYLLSPWVNEADWPFFIRLPDAYYFQEPVAGILMAVPFLAIALIPLVRMLSGKYKRNPLDAGEGMNPDVTGDRRDRMWWVITITGVAISSFLADCLYGYSSMRYQADYLPVLIVLALFSFYQAAGHLERRPWLRKLYLSAGFLMGILSALIGTWLGLTGEFSQFEEINPALFYIIRDMIHF